MPRRPWEDDQDTDGLAKALDEKIDRRLGALERFIAGLNEDVEMQSKQIGYLLSKLNLAKPGAIPSEDDKPIVAPDKPWLCQKCGCRLGFYDEAAETLRVRHKDFTAYIHIEKGHVSIPCRACGELNTIGSD